MPWWSSGLSDTLSLLNLDMSSIDPAWNPCLGHGHFNGNYNVMETLQLQYLSNTNMTGKFSGHRWRLGGLSGNSISCIVCDQSMWKSTMYECQKLWDVHVVRCKIRTWVICTWGETKRFLSILLNNYNVKKHVLEKMWLNLF